MIDRIIEFSLRNRFLVNNNPTEWDHQQQGNNLHGFYGSFGSWLHRSKVEPYLLYRTNHNLPGQYSSWTYGLRMAGAAGPRWSYETEVLGQHGHVSADTLAAWGGMAQLQRHFKNLVWQPTVMGEVNYASGDRGPGDGKVNTLDQLYPTNHSIYGIADQIGRRNNKNIRYGLWVHPEKRLTIKGEGNYFWLANSHDGLYSSSGAMTVAPVAGGAKFTDIGPEADIIGDFKLSKHYNLGAQAGHLFPGKFLRTYSKGGSRSFYAVYVDVRL